MANEPRKPPPDAAGTGLKRDDLHDAVIVLRGIYIELKRANDQRDQWAREALRILGDAKEGT